jgi:hypothetical protein
MSGQITVFMLLLCRLSLLQSTAVLCGDHPRSVGFGKKIALKSTFSGIEVAAV